MTAESSVSGFRARAALVTVPISTLGIYFAAGEDWLGLGPFFLFCLGVFACSIGAVVVVFGRTRHSLCRGAGFGVVSGSLAYFAYLTAAVFGLSPLVSPVIASVTLAGALMGGILAVILESYGRKHARVRFWSRAGAGVVVLLLLAVLLPRLASLWQQQRFVELVEASGGAVRYDHRFALRSAIYRDQDEGRLDWLRSLLGKKYVVSMSLARVAPDNVRKLRKFRKLEEVMLRREHLTDEVVAILHALPNLTGLRLQGDDVTDDTLARIRSLSQLEFLDLDSTSVTDNGLKQLDGLKQLQMLGVRRTSVTQAGLTSFLVAHPRCRIAK